MRIAILNLTGGGMSGGYQNYLFNVLPRLTTHPDVEAIFCATPPSVGFESWFSALPKVQFMPCRPFRFMRHRPDDHLKRSVCRFYPDVVFIPVERYLHWENVPVVTMIQNMGPLVSISGNPWSERLRYVAQRYEAKIAVRHASRVIAPTHFVQEFLTRTWKIPEAKVRTIYYGSNLSTVAASGCRPVAIPKEWVGQFLFTFGSIEPYRGLEDLLGALGQIRWGDKLQGLVIAGAARDNMQGYQKKLRRWIDNQCLTSRVIWTGQLNKEEASWCYKNCRAFVMTSRIESFGIIGLEALAHGCICIVAQNPPLTEIFGKAARYYTPYDSQSLAKAIEETLALVSDQRQVASQLASKRAAVFSWDQNVKQLLTVFHDAGVLRTLGS